MSATLDPRILSTAAQCFTRMSGVNVRPGSPRTDGTNIWLPGMKADLTPNELLILRGYFDHESAHLIYDSFAPMRHHSGSTEQKTRAMFNAVEDARIEARLNDEYPGTVGSIAAIGRHGLAQRNASPSEMTAYDQATHAVLWRLKGVDPSEVTYCPAGWQVLDAIDTTELDAFDLLGTSAEQAMDLARLLADRVTRAIDELRKSDEPEPEPEPGDSGDSGDGDTEPGDQAEDSAGKGGGDTEGPESNGDSEPSDSGDDDTGVGTGPASERWSSESEAGYADSTYADAIDGMTTEDSPCDHELSLYRHQQASAVDRASRTLNNPGGYSGFTRPLANLYQDLHRDAMRMARSLRPHLEATDRIHWTLPRESGHRIDRRTLPTVAAGLGIAAFNRRRVDRAHKTQVTILLDVSGSMKRRCDAASRAAYTVADACESLGCPTRILGFDCELWDIKRAGRVTPSTRYCSFSCGGTLLLPGLIREGMESAALPYHRRVVFVITDGGVGDEQPSVDWISHHRESGVDSHGIAIDSGVNRVHHACNTQVRCRTADLAERMEEALRSYHP